MIRRVPFLVLALAACVPGVVAQYCHEGIAVPDGFCMTIFAENLGRPRHLAIAPNGDVFVAVPAGRDDAGTPGVWGLRDTDGDGVADVRERLVDDPQAQDVALWIRDDRSWLYYSTNSAVMRLPWTPGDLAVGGSAETIVSGMTNRGSHAAKTFELSDDGMLYVNVGAPSNSCQAQDRQQDVPGQDPCPLLAIAGGVWRFDADRPGQTQEDGTHFATGMRNMVALALHPETGVLYGVQHGRDMLSASWGWSDSANAELPAEEFLRIHAGDDFGWPYCYYDPQRNLKVLAPEYGGDGATVGRCADKKDPILAFPAHWAPNGLAFYDRMQFPEEYRGGAFVAFHGSWNRAPLPQEGYNLVFVPFTNGRPTGDWRVFADEFRPASRPVDVVVTPDGALIVSDDRMGRLYRIAWDGES